MNFIKYLIILVLSVQFIIVAQNQETDRSNDPRLNFIPPNISNLVSNPGFEELNSNNMPISWSGDQKIFSIDNRTSYKGKNSLKFKNYDPAIYKTYYQKLNIIPGGKYKFSAYIKTKNIVGEDTGASICLQWADKNGNWLGGAYPFGIKGNNNWTYVEDETQVSIEASSGGIYCYVRKGMTGEAWFDDIMVKQYFEPSMLSYFSYPKYRGLYKIGNTDSISITTELTDYVTNLNRLNLNYFVHEKYNHKIIINNNSQFSINTTRKFTFNSKELGVGDYIVNISLIDKVEHTLVDNRILKLKVIPPDYRQKVYIDDSLRTIVDGKPFFPIGMYFWNITESDLKIYSDSKFNCLMPYPNTTIEQMDLAAKYNLKVVYSIKDDFFNLKSKPKEIQNITQEEEYIKNKIDEIKYNKALLAWYVADELKPESIPQIKAHYELLCQLDKNHPAWAVLADLYNIKYFINTFDIIGTDPYPINFDKLSRVTKYTLETAKQVNYVKPLWMVIQAHNLGVYPWPTQNPRAPTYQEMRNMAWQSICEGAKGIFFYSFFDLKKDPDQSFKVQWNNLKEIAAEIDKYSQIVLSIDKVPNVIINSSEKPNWFHFLVKSSNGVLYIFAVDDGDGIGTIKFEINKKIKKITELNERKQIYFDVDYFNDNYQNYDFKIYKIELN